MKRLLGLLLVMGIVGCGGGEAPDWVSKDGMWVQRGGLTYATKGDSETPFTGVVVAKHKNGQKEGEATWKDGKLDGLWTQWHENGQKAAEVISKDGKKVSGRYWDEQGNERFYDKYGNEIKK